MAQVKMPKEISQGKTAPPATPNVAAVASATHAVTVAETNALTTLNKARRPNAVSLGRMDAMSAGPTAIVAQRKMPATNPSMLTTWQHRSIAWNLPHKRRQLTPTTWATALLLVNKKPVLTAQRPAKNAPAIAMVVSVDPVVTALSKVIARSGLSVMCSR